MERFSRVIFWLAVLFSLIGLYGLYQRRMGLESTSVDSWLAMGVSALSDPLILGAFVTAVVGWGAGRWLDRPAVQPMVRRRHALDGVTRSDGAVRETTGHQLEQLRQRLRGRPSLVGGVPGWVDQMLAEALGAGASDVHVQPLEDRTRVTARVAGHLEELAALPKDVHEQVVRRIKILAGLVPYESRSPQDGRIGLETTDGEVDVRVSVLPTHHGERVVLRFLHGAAGLFELTALGMETRLLGRYSELLREPQGMIVLSGPAGSGKSTTLYSSLRTIHQQRGESVNIATLEDPIEVELPFLNQTQIDSGLGMNFAQTLRAVLRQDPNVLMIGEIRDGESAQIAVQAGLTGHLILTTLHAESSVSVFYRLIDIGVEPFLVSSAVSACLTQRLVRSLCPDCRRPMAATRKQRRSLGRHGIAIDGLNFFASAGCGSCDRRGYRGRTAIFELLWVTPEIRQLVASRAPASRLAEVAGGQGMVPLARAAVEAAARGRCSLDEVLRAIG